MFSRTCGLYHNRHNKFCKVHGKNLIILPETVLDEIDSKKSGFEEINYQAREFARILSEAEVLDNDKYGLFFEKNSSSISKLVNEIEESPSMLNKFIDKGVIRIKERYNWKRIIIVTDNFHTRRALHAFEKVFHGSGMVVQASGAENDVFSSENWWKSDRGILSYFSETIKFFRKTSRGKHYVTSIRS